MKAKRLTALALAALMAASTTSVALAGERVDADLDFVNDGYYKYNSDTNRLESAKRDEFQPGDDVYLRLKEDPSDTFSNKKTYNAYADWTIGDSWVKDIDVVYRKGDVITSTSTKNYYSITGVGTLLGWNVSSTETTKSQEDLKTELKNNEKYKKAISYYKAANYHANQSGYASKSGTTFYADLQAAQITESNKDSGISYNGKYYATLEEAGLGEFVENSYVMENHYYADIQAVLTNGLQMTEYKVATPDAGDEFYIKESDVADGYGIAATESKDETTAKASEKLSGVEVIRVKKGDQLYWLKKDNAIAFVNTVFSKTLENGSTYSGTNYWNKTTFDLVAKTSAPAWNGVVYTYNGVSYTSKTDALDAAGIREYTGYVNKDKTNTVADNEVETQAAAVVNADLDKSVKYETKNVTNTQPQYEYWVKITTKDSATTKDIDIVGSIWVGTSKSSAKKEKDGSEDKFRADFTLTNSDPGNDDYDEATDYVSIEPGERAVVSFADDASDEFEVEFGDDARFVFNARGQGKLNLAYNTKYNKDFAYDYDDANIDFINFEGEPTTNRTGTLYIYADEDSYIYEVTSKGAKKINGAYYDDDEEAWVIRTRNLTSYAISDKKLKTVDQMDNGSSSNSSNKPGSSNNKPGNGKPNPDTGR